MAILTKDEAQALMKKVLSYSKADECEVNLNCTDAGNVRYALNKVTTSAVTSQTQLAVASAFGKKLGIATINEFDDELDESVMGYAILRPDKIVERRPVQLTKRTGTIFFD